MAKYKVPRHNVIKNFSIVEFASGTYVCPGWIPVDKGTTREDVEFIDNITIENKENSAGVIKETQQELIYKVPSSNGKSEYLVKFQYGDWSCNCPASMFKRGNCKHIKELKIKSNV